MWLCEVWSFSKKPYVMCSGQPEKVGKPDTFQRRKYWLIIHPYNFLMWHFYSGVRTMRSDWLCCPSSCVAAAFITTPVGLPAFITPPRAFLPAAAPTPPTATQKTSATQLWPRARSTIRSARWFVFCDASSWVLYLASEALCKTDSYDGSSLTGSNHPLFLICT